MFTRFCFLAAFTWGLLPLQRANGQDPDPAPDSKPSTEIVVRAQESWTGDYDAMCKRRFVRVLVAYGRTSYFLDRGQQRGVTYDMFKEVETFINEREKSRTLAIHVVFIPVPRDRLIAGLLEGRGDIAAANLTITDGRLDQVDFTDPLLEGVRELVVAGPQAAELGALDDLAEKEMMVRRTSSYNESLSRLSDELRARGKAPVTVTPASESLEDEDLLELVQAGIVDYTVVDSHIAEFWSQIFSDLRVYNNLAVRSDGKIAWAIRKDSPVLKGVLNEFIRAHKKGTTFGNILFKRYLKDTKFVRNATAPDELARFDRTAGLIRKYSDEYGFDWLLIGAQAYQESRLDQNLRSKAGAVGVMQIKPGTAAGAPIGIENVEKLENNIQAGVKFLAYLRDEYFSGAELDSFNRQLFVIAAYNAGAARIAGLRKKAPALGLDPNKWFLNVEIVAAQEIGRETTQYVGNILKYYVAYQHVLSQRDAREQALQRTRQGP